MYDFWAEHNVFHASYWISIIKLCAFWHITQEDGTLDCLWNLIINSASIFGCCHKLIPFASLDAILCHLSLLSLFGFFGVLFIEWGANCLGEYIRNAGIFTINKVPYLELDRLWSCQRKPFLLTLKQECAVDDRPPHSLRYFSNKLMQLLPGTEMEYFNILWSLKIKLTFNFISPFLKCLCLTLNSSPSIVVSKPSRPVTTVSNGFEKLWSAGSPLMNQVKCAAGFDLPDVQFKRTGSPIW